MNRYTLSVLCGGALWGFMGFFTRHLSEIGIDSSGAILVRCSIAALCFGLVLLFTDPKQFRIRWKDLWCFLGSGLLSLLFFTFCYFNAIALMDLSTAAILLYIAPTLVMLLSALLFREKITGRKILAVVLAFLGCALVSGIVGGVTLTLRGLLFGIGSGVGYALYTIFCRFAMQRGYSGNTVNFYSCVLASVGALLLWGAHGTFTAMVSSPAAVFWCIGTGVLTCFLPYMFYTYSLIGLENSKASVLSSVEPVVASLVGVFLFGERVTLPSLCGIILVLCAVLLLNQKDK